MTKIDQEEYHVLKSLSDRWKWIARDSAGYHGGNLFVYSKKPFKRYDEGEWDWDCGIGISSIDNHRFQFIQWEDEEPCRIAELIEEYENWLKGYEVDWDKVFGRESEETEVKKDIEWLKRKVLGLQSNGNDETYQTEAEKEIGRLQKWAWNNCVHRVFDLITQLDEPEVLSQEWIDKHMETIFDLDQVFGTEFIEVDDLQKLLMPKQEGLEAKIQELIEVYKRENGAYSNTENGWIGGFIEDLENLVEEEEQKYYVLNSEGETMIRKSDSRVRTSSGFKIKNGFENENYKFTEQEIKDYDPRFWPFAVKVEELE